MGALVTVGLAFIRDRSSFDKCYSWVYDAQRYGCDMDAGIRSVAVGAGAYQGV